MRAIQCLSPLAVDGVLYFGVGYSIVHAVDAASGTFAVDLRSASARGGGTQAPAGLGNPRHRVLGSQDLRRHARWTPAGDRRAHGQARLERRDGAGQRCPLHQRSAARVQRQGDHRARRRRRGLHTRLRDDVRRTDRQAALALLHGARQPGRRLRKRCDADGREDLGRRVVEVRRRRHRLERDHLRRAVQPHLSRRRQWRTVEPQAAQRRPGRQPVPGIDRGARRRHRQVRVALPGEPRRKLGLQRGDGHRADEPQDRRQGAPGPAARAEERLFLCDRPQQRQADLGRAVRESQLGIENRPDRPAGPSSNRTFATRLATA